MCCFRTDLRLVKKTNPKLRCYAATFSGCELKGACDVSLPEADVTLL
uniref:Uncharacterized protein n=1 Tax=Anguilla anguilla TaxID=7936 RepID=A0A0E9PRQ7_ANGAN